MSASLFALALDPIIKDLRAQHWFRSARITMLADDIA